MRGRVAQDAAIELLLVRDIAQVKARGGALKLLCASLVLVAREAWITPATHQAVALLVERRRGGGRVAFYDGIAVAQALALVLAQLFHIHLNAILRISAANEGSQRREEAEPRSALFSSRVRERPTGAVHLLLLHPLEPKVGWIDGDAHDGAARGQE